MKAIRQVLKTTGKLIAYPMLTLLTLILVYVASAFGLLLFPANTTKTAQENPDIAAYVVSNGVHTDFVFPVQTALIDWRHIFPVKDVMDQKIVTDFIGIGWGDREFYLNTPHWKDLTASRALHALFGHDQSLMHIEYMSRAEVMSFDQRYRLDLRPDQYTTLIHYVLGTVALQQGNAQVITGRHYDTDDAFFVANGSYNLFHTCNTWIGSGLQQAGIKVSRWTPFDRTVYWYLPPAS